MNKGLIFVISAPSGAGKNTLADMLLEKYMDLKRCVTFTTREPRVNEKNGEDYFFISKKEFEQKINRGDFLEYAKIYQDYYGTDKNSVENILKQGDDVLLVIDVQGAAKLKSSGAVLIFIIPPSLGELKNRLCKRGTEKESQVKERLAIAEKELKEAQFYEYQIVNDSLKEAFYRLSLIVEEKRRKNAR